MSKHGNFYEAISKLLVKNLDKYKEKSLNRETCISIYQTIFETLQQVVEGAQLQSSISNESMNWLAQAFYDSVSINNNQETDPNIFTQRASLDKVPTKELAFLAVMLKDTAFAGPVVGTIKRRS